MASVDLTCLEIAVTVKKKLLAAGFRSTSDVGAITATDLAKAASLSPLQALAVCQAVDDATQRLQFGNSRHAKSPETLSALALMERHSAPPIVTFCKELDALLGGGVQLCELTEFCGAPGVGKTQLGIQLAVDTCIPPEFGGVAGSTVYIDTEGSFHVSRAVQMASALVKRLNEVSQDGECGISLESVLGSIHVYRCCSAAELMATCRLLPEFVKQHPNVKLVVLDSIAFHFRHDIQDMAARARILATLAQSFHELAYEKQLAVVVMNQVTTRVLSSGATLVPALGESWSHACTNRLMLCREADQRVAKLLKSTSRRMGTASYAITTDGVRDVTAKRKDRPQGSHLEAKDSEDDLTPPAKAPRTSPHGEGMRPVLAQASSYASRDPPGSAMKT